MSARFDVFLSHNNRDKPLVEEIARRLKEAGVEPWLDRWCLTPGGDWQEELAQGLLASAACAICCGPSGLGNWENLEYKVAIDRMAADHSFRVFYVLLPGLPDPFDASQLPVFLRSARTWVDLRKGPSDPRAFQSLVHAVKGLPLGPEPPADPRLDLCPYRGLLRFEESDAEFFFGREGDIQRLLEKLKGSRFLAVIGPSGSGKSSVVRAGLVARLKKGALPDSQAWRFMVLTPGAKPLSALATHAARLDSHKAVHQFLRELAEDPRALHLNVARALAERPAQERVMWVIDQFEELFTQGSEEAERRQFLGNLLFAASVPDGRCYVILTLRADFYAHCAVYPELSSLLAAQQHLVGPMDAEGLRAAIAEPARRVGLEFESGLVETIWEDVDRQAGALPLLEHGLLELWQRRRGRLLTLAAYRESGGVAGAIARRAGTILADFSPEQQAVAKRILLRLIQPGEGAEDTRRRATFNELLSQGGQDQPAQTVINALTEARLLVTSTDPQTGDNVVEVAHESLIRGWPQLRRWIDDDRSALRLHRRLTEAAQEWQAAHRDESLLYRGARLAQAVEWRERDEAALNDLERTFLESSVAAQEREQRARARLRNRITFGLAAGLLLALVLAALATVQTRRAVTQRRIAQSRQLAAQALIHLDGEHDLALLIASEAGRVQDTTESRRSLLTALGANIALDTYLHHTSEVYAVAFSPDGKTLATGCGDHRIYLWNVETRQPAGPSLTGHKFDVLSLAFSPDGKTLASGGPDGAIIWETSSGRAIGSFDSNEPKNYIQQVNSLAFSPDGRWLASSADRRIFLWDVVTRQPLGPPLTNHSSTIYSLAFSPDGRWLASGSGASLRHGSPDYSLFLWDVATRQPVAPGLTGHSNTVTSVAFSPDGKVLAASSMDNRLGSSHDSVILFWSVPTWQRLDLVLTNREVSSLAFSPVSKSLAVAWGQFFYPLGKATNGAISVYDSYDWTRRGGRLRKTFTGHQGRQVAYSKDGKRLASAGADGNAILWNVHPQHPLAEPLIESRSPFMSVAFSPDGKWLAAGTLLGSLEIIDTATRKSVTLDEPGDPFSDDRIWSLAFHLDGRTLALGARLGKDSHAVLLWDIAAGKLRGPPMLGHTGEVSSVAFHPSGKVLASGSEDRTVIFWDPHTQQPVGQPIVGHSGPVLAVAFSGDGRHFASGGDDGNIILRSAESRAPLGPPLQGHQRGVSSLAFRPDGKLLASGGKDSLIVLWDVATRQPVGHPLAGHWANVAAVTFSPDGRFLASASADIDRGDPDDAMILWDVASRQALGPPLRAHWNRIRSLAFSPNGSTLASGSDDTSIILWDMRLEAWQQRARRIANRDLTPEERRQFFGTEP